jgi:hypothetical protein
MLSFVSAKKLFCLLFMLSLAFVFLGGAMAESRDYLSEKCRIKSMTADDLKKLVPENISGWKAVTEDRIFNPGTIFDYIDGAGEVYRSYNFRLLLARRFQQPEKPDLVVDLFDMGTSYDAFGIFTHDREGEKLDIGQMAVYKGGLLSFWKDRFFVSVYAEDETPETKEAVPELGRQIAARIEAEGKPPDLLDFLPTAGLEGETVRYFHTHHILNYHFFVSDENILQLGAEIEAVLGKYKSSGRLPMFLLVVRYADEVQALYAWNTFCKNYMPDARVPGEIKVEDGSWTVAKQKNQLLAAVFQASTDREARSLIDGVLFKKRKK